MTPAEEARRELWRAFGEESRQVIREFREAT
jgi:hypothetical protein